MRSRTARWSSTCREMRSVTVDPDRRRARAGGGALWEDIDGATVAHGLATTGGTFVDTGIGGLTLSGGIGFLMGTAGLTCDNLMRRGGRDRRRQRGRRRRGRRPGAALGAARRWRQLRRRDGVRVLAPRRSGRSTPVASPTHLDHATEALEVTAPDRARWPAGARAVHRRPDDRAAARCLTVRHRVRPTTSASPASSRAPRPTPRRPCAPLRAVPGIAGGFAAVSLPELQASCRDPPVRAAPLLEGPLRPRPGRRRPSTRSVDRDARRAGRALVHAPRGDQRPSPRSSPTGGAAFGQREARWNVSALGVWEDPADDDVADRLGRGRPPRRSGRRRSAGAGYGNYAPVDETDGADPGGVRRRSGSRDSARSSAATTRTTSSGSTTTSRPPRAEAGLGVSPRRSRPRRDLDGLEATGLRRRAGASAAPRSRSSVSQCAAGRRRARGARACASSGRPPVSSSAIVRCSSARASSNVRSAIGGAASVGSVTGILIVGFVDPLGQRPRRGATSIPRPIPTIATTATAAAKTSELADHAPCRHRRRSRRCRRAATRMRSPVPGGASPGSRTIAPSRCAADDGVAALERRAAGRGRRGPRPPCRATTERRDPRRPSARQRDGGALQRVPGGRSRAAVWRGSASAAASSRRRSRASRASTARVARSNSRPTCSRAAARRAAGLTRSRARRSTARSRAAVARRRSVARREPIGGPSQRPGHLEPVRHDDLGGGRRGGRADVGREVGQRDIDLVADAADHRHRVGHDGPHDPLVVERPEVLERAAAAGEDRHGGRVVGPALRAAGRGVALDAAERGHEARRRLLALDLRRDEHDLDERPAAGQHVADVAPDRAGSGS